MVASSSMSPEAILVRLASLRSGVDIAKVATTTDELTDSSLTYDPNEVYRLGSEVLKKHSGYIRSDLERFALYEQVFTAALDTGNLKEARSYLDKILARFPEASSIRARRLVGLLAEAEGDTDRALDIYSKALVDDEANLAVRKRIIALHRSNGRRAEAIKLLVELVDTFAQDFESWSELASLYMAECMFQQAVFCVEEMLVLRPRNHLLQIRFADLLHTVGKDDLALKYYSSALVIVKDHIRALYGLRLVSGILIKKVSTETASGANTSPSVKGGKNAKDNQISSVSSSSPLSAEAVPSLRVLKELHELAGERIAAVYEERTKGALSDKVKNGSEVLISVVNKWLSKSSINK